MYEARLEDVAQADSPDDGGDSDGEWQIETSKDLSITFDQKNKPS